jgi:predicted 3-demethylubiquinone-9 3-methyltransferase (glyoxalase superfamily)
MKKIQKITPFLWFDTQAEQAAEFYVSIFKNAPLASGDSKVLNVNRYDEAGAKVSGMPLGSAMVASFQLGDQDFAALNGGKFFQFSGAVSFVVNCETQEEVDYFWEKLSEGGEKGQCGWINHDKFGVTWQVVPIMLDKLLGDADSSKSQRVMEAMLKMTKIVIADLEKAYKG